MHRTLTRRCAGDEQAETTTAVNRLEDQLLEAAKRHAELAEAMQKQTRQLAEVDTARSKLAAELAAALRNIDKVKEDCAEQLNRERRAMAVRPARCLALSLSLSLSLSLRPRRRLPVPRLAASPRKHLRR